MGERVQVRAPSGRTAAAFKPFDPRAAQALEAELKETVAGSVDFSAQARALFATDASNYRQVPIGVVAPRTRDDVVETVRLCRKFGAPVLARGGGTSLAGQASNVAVVIDFSRHLNRVLSLEPEVRRARVQPGCILDDLREQAERHRLTFGPDPATHTRNTLGGMIGNNSGGVHSVLAGRTSDNVERLTVLTYDGELLDVGPTPEDELSAIIAGGGRRGEIYRKLRDLRDRYGPVIEARYPDIPRRVSGYQDLDALLPGRGFNVAKALTGTEGSCVLVLDATLKLVPSPPCRALAVLGFADIFQAADAVPRVLEFAPVGLEGFDDLLFRYVDRANVSNSGLRFFPNGCGWLIVETGGNSPDEARAAAQRIADALSAQSTSTIVADPDEQEEIWSAREASLGATAFVPGQPETWEGWEDSAVPRESLGDYLRDLKALMHRYDYEGAFYGHFGDGVVHSRMNFELHTEEGLATWRAFLREAAELVTTYNGSLSGEHGDGEARAELLELMYGPELVQCFREFKAIWDPENRMNPGKVADPFPITANIRLGPNYSPRKLSTHFAFEEDHGSFAHATVRCVGVGKCRRRDPDGEVMCPSYLVTEEEKHSTRGRAHLLHEMVRGEVIKDGWDSAEVEDALSLCLACKGCKSDCPVGVDVATYKAEFRAHHYRRRLRPRSAYSLGLVQKWASLAEPVPWLANFILHSKPLSALSKRVGGIHPRATLPHFANRSFRAWFRDRHAGAAGAAERVMLWPDTFNNYFRPGTAIAATRLLEAAGYSVAIPERQLCCGRPLYDWGFLKRAKSHWEEIFETLEGEIAAGTPLIGLEPACTSAFKDELLNLFPQRPEAKRLSEQIVDLSTFVLCNFERFPEARRGGRVLVQPHCHHHAVIGLDAEMQLLERFPQARRGGQVLVQPHCHHHAVIGLDAEMQLLERVGLDAERPPQGCCGMAGAFGFAVETHDLSLEIGERVLLPKVREAPDDTIILADGFSCRGQIEQGTGRTALHIADLLAERML